MGYSMSQVGGEFRINYANKQAALKRGRPIFGHWVREGEGEGARCRTLEELFDLWGYRASTDDDGNITALSFESEKIGVEKKLFDAIAGCVVDGSYLEMCGEESDHWRWCFDGTSCTEKAARVQW